MPFLIGDSGDAVALECGVEPEAALAGEATPWSAIYLLFWLFRYQWLTLSFLSVRLNGTCYSCRDPVRSSLGDFSKESRGSVRRSWRSASRLGLRYSQLWELFYDSWHCFLLHFDFCSITSKLHRSIASSRWHLDHQTLAKSREPASLAAIREPARPSDQKPFQNVFESLATFFDVRLLNFAKAKCLVRRQIHQPDADQVCQL